MSIEFFDCKLIETNDKNIFLGSCGLELFIIPLLCQKVVLEQQPKCFVVFHSSLLSFFCEESIQFLGSYKGICCLHLHSSSCLHSEMNWVFSACFFFFSNCKRNSCRDEFLHTFALFKKRKYFKNIIEVGYVIVSSGSSSGFISGSFCCSWELPSPMYKN